MKIASLLIGLASLALVGCNADPHPSPGMSAAVIKVVAEPKIGSAAAPGHVASYDGGDLGAGGSGAFARVDYSDLPDIVVWLESADGATAYHPPAGAVAVDLGDGSSPPGISAVACVGQKMVFKNAGAVSVAAYSVSDGNPFKLGTIPPGGSAEATAASEGLIEIVTASTKEPLARVYAAPTTWIALSRSDGRVVFNDVPPGRYRLVSWHPRLPGTASDIVLVADKVNHASIDVGVNHLPKVTAK
jgi:hypothetical protein